jgi:hypothetical protein
MFRIEEHTMKRKYSASFFLLGLLQTAIRYVFILLIGLFFLIIGYFGIKIFRSIGTAALIFYALLCIVEQLKIRSLSLKQSGNPEFNEFMNSILGIRNHDENDPPTFDELMKRKIEASKENDDSDHVE